MKYIKSIFLLVCITFVTSCVDYLDIVPNDVATMENAFTNRTSAEMKSGGTPTKLCLQT